MYQLCHIVLEGQDSRDRQREFSMTGNLKLPQKISQSCIVALQLPVAAHDNDIVSMMTYVSRGKTGHP